MIAPSMSREPALFEVLDDLRHDLAKYLGLPLRMLPRDADQVALRLALEQALHHTRQRSGTSLAAREIYAALRIALLAASAEAGAARLLALDEAVERALAWEAALSGVRPLDRAAIERDFGAVTAAIDSWLSEARRG